MTAGKGAAAITMTAVLALAAAAPQTSSHASNADATSLAGPVILRGSDAVQPGTPLTLFGEGFDAATDITFTDDGTDCPIATLADDGHYVTCLVPAARAPGLMPLTVSTAAGAASHLANAPVPQWINEDEAWPGQQVRAVGRNLDAAEFGGPTDTRVRLRSGSSTVPAAVLESSPFMVLFEVPGVSPGPYVVEVSNDGGGHWRALSGLQQLSVVAPGADPQQLGVAWAGDFTWTQYDAADFGVVGDGVTDDTAALQHAVDSVKGLGGGVLVLADGTYNATALALPAGIVLTGSGPAQTTLRYVGSGGSRFIRVKNDGVSDGLVGLSRMTITTAGETRPDVFMSLGNNISDPSRPDLRTAEKIFLQGIVLDSPMSNPPASNQRGIAVVVNADRHVLVDTVAFSGNRGNIGSAYVTAYMTVRDSTFDYAAGSTTVPATYSVVTGNQLTGHDVAGRASGRGFQVKTHAYVANNQISGFGDPDHNDGEAILAEVAGGGTKMYGQVESASGPDLVGTAISARNWDLSDNTWGRWHVLITGGTGMGQLLRVTGLDESTRTLTSDRAWRVPPDSTSTFAVILPMMFNTFVENAVSDTAKGIWFYGDSYGGVIADNTTVDSEGVLVNTVHNPSTIRFNVAYFDRVTRNETTGHSPLSGFGHVGLRMSLESSSAVPGTIAYGTHISDNIVTGSDPLPPPGGYSEAPDVNGVFAYKTSSPTPAQPAGAAVLVSSNTMNHLDTGITIDEHIRDLKLFSNTFNDVTVPYNTDLDPLPIIE